MKYNFSFMQVINWLLVCKNNLLKIEEEKQNLTREELIYKLKLQKEKVLIVKDILDRKVKLQGINADFLRNFKEIKRSYGIKD